MYILEIIWKKSTEKPKFEPYDTAEKAIQIRDVYLQHDTVAAATVYECRKIERVGK